MRKCTSLVAFFTVPASICDKQTGGGYNACRFQTIVDTYPSETAISVLLNDDSPHYNGHKYVNLCLPIHDGL